MTPELARRLLPVAEQRQAEDLATLPPDYAGRVRAYGQWLRERLADGDEPVATIAEGYCRFIGLDPDAAMRLAQGDIQGFPAFVRSRWLDTAPPSGAAFACP